MSRRVQTESVILGKKAPPVGTCPAFVLIDPKKSDNLAKIVRTASCYGFKQVWYTGERVRLDLEGKDRLPREERMKGYKEVDIAWFDRPFDCFPRGATPVAVELLPGSESLFEFEHPDNAFYVFGPEDGSIPAPIRALCHRFVQIPTRHCLNLSVAASTIAYDRAFKRWMAGKEPMRELAEHRGFIESLPWDDE